MPSPSASLTSLSERLQTVTEALATAQTQEDVLRVVLTSALEALAAAVSAVLLGEEGGEHLRVAAAQGGEEGARTLWQDGPLDGTVPTGDALERREPLFFEQAGELVRAYPELGARAAAVATAVLPMFLDDRPLGVIILEFREPRHFTPEEKRFLRTLASQCAVALGRVRLLTSLGEELARRQQTEQDLRGSEARFRRMVEASPVAIAAGDPSGRLILVNDTYLRLIGYTRAEFEAGEIDWTSLTPPEYHAADERAFRQAFERGSSDAYAKEMLTRTGERVPLSLVLVRYEDGEQSLVVGYLQDQRLQRTAEGALREHSAELERQVTARTQEAERSRSQAEVLAALGDALQRATSPEEVADLALPHLGPALGAQSMLVVRVEGEGIRLPTLWGDTPEVITRYMTRPGLRLSETPMLHRAAQTGRGLYLNDYRAEPGTVASFPALAGGAEPILLPSGTLEGFLVTWRPTELGPWGEAERDLLRRAAGTLGLALERAGQAARLELQNAELGARTRALEGFAHLTRDLSMELDPIVLVRRAQEVVLSLLPQGYALYFEPEGDRWVPRGQTGELRSEALQALADAGLPYQEANNLLIPYHSLEPYYQDQYARNTDNLDEMVAHLGASATLPVLVKGLPRGVFAVVLFGELRPWSSAERATMETVVRSLGLALERAEGVRQLEEERAALAAFARFTEESTHAVDVLTLARGASDVLHATLNVQVGYSELEGGLWKGRVFSQATPPEVVEQAGQGFPADLPSFARPFQGRDVVFVDGWDASREGAASTEVYGAAALYPYFEDGRPHGLLTMGSPEARAWTERERSVFRSVGRSLALAFERAAATRALAAQNAELDARTRALEAFEEWTRDLTLSAEPPVLIERAQELLLDLLPVQAALYYERDGERWYVRSMRGEYGSDGLRLTHEAGLRHDETDNVRVPFQTGETYYQDVYGPGTDGLTDAMTHFSATAIVPLRTGRGVRGLLGLGRFGQANWTDPERTIIETVRRSLELALDRAEAAQDLMTTQLRLRAVVDNAPVVLFALDRHGTFTLSEGRGLTGLGLAPGQAVGHSAHDLYRDTPGLLDDLRLALAGQEVHQTRRVGDRVFETWTIPMYGAAGDVTEVVGVSTDVSERRQAEEDLERSNEELRRSNAELEQFAYIASHDLQAPIRAVTSFAGVIDRRYGERLDDRGRLYLRQIVESGEHMKRLVDDLLAFSRVHTEQRALLPVDLGVVCGAVVGRLHTQTAALGMSVTRGNLPRVLGDAQQLDQLLQNLISNGLKYHREGVTPQVHVTAEPDGEMWRFAVSDNGIGIEPQYFERIFEIFQRLHGRERYEGTGIGLAVCKKIVERHGGRLWLESTPGEGSTFFFTLPQG